jgi:hypothetical protein
MGSGAIALRPTINRSDIDHSFTALGAFFILIVLDTSRMDHDLQQIANRVDHKMTLATVDLFASIIASFPPGLGGFDTLSVNHPGTKS